MEKITNDEITNADLKKFLNKKNNFIKDGWLDGIEEKIFVYKSKDDLSIIDCINKCTSPTGDKEEEKLKSIFRAFSLFPMDETKILILGQDPYPDNDKDRVNEYGKRAHGLAFSFANSKGEVEPADDSLLNIFKAIKAYKDDCKFDEVDNNKIKGDKDSEPWETNLKEWATTNKVLLLNTALTYNNLYPSKKEKELKKSEKSKQEKCQKEHADIWKPFVTQIICNLIKNKKDGLAIFLWGVPSQQLFYKCIDYKCEFLKKLGEASEKLKNSILVNKEEGIEINNNKFFLTSHPCNKSAWRGFKDNSPNHFKSCDEFLFGNDEEKYIWKNFPENNQKNT